MSSRGRLLKIGLDFLIFGLAVIVLIFVVPKVIIFFWPVVIGYIVACFVNPIVRFMEERIKIVRKHGSALVILLVIIVTVVCLYGLGYMIITQVRDLIKELPILYDKLEDSLDSIGQRYRNVYDAMPRVLQNYLDNLRNMISLDNDRLSGYGMSEKDMHMRTNGATYSGLSVGMAKATINGFTTGVISIIFAIMSAYFFTAQKDKIICRLRLVMSGNMMKEIRKVTSNFKSVLGGYMKVQIKIMCILIVVLYIGFIFCGISHALGIAVLVGILDFLPFIGIGIVLLPWALFMILSGNYIFAIKLLFLYVICLVIREVGEPKMFGKSIGIGTYETFFLLFVGFKLGGVLGLLFSVPFGVLWVNIYKSGALNSLIDDCKYMFIMVDTFRREGKKSINKEINGRINNNDN